MNNIKYYIKSHIELIEVMYIIIIGGISYLLPIPDIIKGFLALPAFVIIPYRIGKLFPLEALINKNLDTVNDDERIPFIVLIISWCLGFLFISLTAMLLFGIRAFNLWIFILFIIALCSYSIFSNMKYSNFRFKSHSIPLFLALILSLNVPLLITYYQDYPFIWGYDIYRHTQYSLRIVDFNFLTYSYDYYPGNYVLISIISKIFNLHTYTFLWATKFLLSPILAFGLYLFSYSLSKDKRIAILCSFMGVWIYPYLFKDTFHSFYSLQPKTLLYVIFPSLMGVIFFFTEHFRSKLQTNSRLIKMFLLSLMPSSLIYLVSQIFISAGITPYFEIIIPFSLIVISIIIIITYIKLTQTEAKSFFLILTIVSSTMIFIHLSMGFAIIFFTIFGLVFYNIFNKKSYVLYLLFSVFVIIVFELNYSNLSINLHIQEIASEYAMIDPYLKVEALDTGYSKPVLLLFFCGVLLSLLRRNNLESIWVISILIVFYFIPIPAIYRILIAATPFVVYFAAKFFVEVLLLLNISRLRILLPLFSLLFVILLLTSEIQAYNNEMKWTSEESKNRTMISYSHIVETSSWIRNNTPKNTLLISDPNTMYFLAGLSDRAYVVGALDSERIALLYKILSQDSSKKISNEIWSLNLSSPYPNEIIPGVFDSRYISLYEIDNNNMTILVAVTGVTTKFINDKRYADGYVLVPTSGYQTIDRNILKIFQDERYFSEIFKIPGTIYLFKVV